jgi:hypothetical protein
MEQLIYKIAGKKYMLFEVPIVGSAGAKKFEQRMKRHKGICQGVKEMKRETFWTSASIIVKALIPEENIIAFNEDED